MGDNIDNEPLLADSGDEKQREAIKVTWRHGVILPSLFFAVFGASLYSYVVSEWTQNKIKTENFPNATIEKANSCESQNKSDPSYIKYEHVQQQTAYWSLLFTLAEYIPMLLVQFVLPSYSDTYGRKFLFILTYLSLCLKAVTITLVLHFEASLWYIFGANIVAGLMGGSFCLFSATFSFTADLTSAKNQRSTAIVLIEAVVMVGFVLGSFLVGYLIETWKFGFYNTSLLASCLCALGFVLIIILPESLPKDKRTMKKSVISTVTRMFEFYFSKDFAGQRTSYILLLLAFFFFSISGMNRSSMETLYFLGQPFCWGPSKIGLFTFARNGAQSVLGLGSVKLLQRCVSDSTVSIISTFSCTTSLIVEAFARSSVTIYMVPVTGMFSFLVIPMIRGMMSSMTSADRQGAVFASVAVIEVTSNLLASTSQNVIYSFTMSFMNGFVFLLMAFFSMATTCLLIAYSCRKPASDALSVNIHVQVKDNPSEG